MKRGANTQKYHKQRTKKLKISDANNQEQTPVYIVKNEDIAFDEVQKSLSALDSQFNNAKMIAKEWTKIYPIQFPDISFTKNEQLQIKKKKVEIKKLEQYLKDKYGKEIQADGWHGRLSIQRILWQDEKFISAFCDPLFTKVVFWNAKENNEGDLTKKNTLSSILLYAIASNRLSYLVSAAPNWENLPKIDGITWNAAMHGQMVLRISKSENPWIVNEQYLRTLGVAMANIQHVLCECYKGSVLTQTETEIKINTYLQNASLFELMQVISKLLNKENIQSFTAGNAGSSTLPWNLNEQCLEILSEYENLLTHHHEDHVAVLGYGIVSHALDARHLAAALYYLNNSDQNANSQSHFQNFITKVQSKEMQPHAAFLIKIRLQQILFTLFEMRNKMILSEKSILAVFQEVIEGPQSWIDYFIPFKETLVNYFFNANNQAPIKNEEKIEIEDSSDLRSSLDLDSEEFNLDLLSSFIIKRANDTDRGEWNPISKTKWEVGRSNYSGNLAIANKQYQIELTDNNHILCYNKRNYKKMNTHLIANFLDEDIKFKVVNSYKKKLNKKID